MKNAKSRNSKEIQIKDSEAKVCGKYHRINHAVNTKVKKRSMSP